MAIEFFSVGQRAEGIIALGQEATGVIAIGQVATGFIAIGQMARGVIAIGQLAVGVVAIGMLAVGPVYCIAMIGAGGRGKGGVLPLMPLPVRKAKLPGLATLRRVAENRETGWLPITIAGRGDTFAIHTPEGPLEAHVPPECQDAANEVRDEGLSVLGLFRPGEGKPELQRMMRIEDEPIARGVARTVLGAAQLAGLAAAAAAVWYFALVDVGDFVLVTLRYVVTGT